MHVSSSIKELIADRWLSGASPDHLAACLDRTGRDEWMDALCGRWHCWQLVDCDWEGGTLHLMLRRRPIRFLVSLYCISGSPSNRSKYA